MERRAFGHTGLVIPVLGFETDERRALALRYAAWASGADCAIVGGTDPRHLERNATVVAGGLLDPPQGAATREAFVRVGAHWLGHV